MDSRNSVRTLEVAYDDDEDVGNTKMSGLEVSFEDELSEAGTSASVFENARKYIETGWLFRTISYLYAERKTLVVCFAHFAATVVVFTHYFLVKYRLRETQVSEGENRYWWKMLAPTIEFALAHTILLQMTLLPLTMSRLSIVLASETVLAKFIPFNRMVRFHIMLGYNMILTTCAAVSVSVTYIALVCSDGEQKFCAKFTSEIMITGYFMLVMLLIVLVSSYLRHVIPYRIFYTLHHLVFVMYIVTAVHTFDRVHRDNERERSQTFKWFSAAVLYYLCDRAAMAMNHSYRTTVVSSSIVASTADNKDKAGSRMVMIKLFRPPLLKFRPGQYAFLRIREIDDEYHPFSVASAPDSDYVEFYIEVFGEGSWTYKLWQLMDEPAKQERQTVGRRIVVDLMGPYGTSLGNTDEYSHAIAIGSGTGIVPMMSLLKQHVQQLLRLDPDQHFLVQERYQKKMYQLHQLSRRRMGSVFDKVQAFWIRSHFRGDHGSQMTGNLSKRKSISVRLKDLSNSDLSKLDRPKALREVKKEARCAKAPIYYTVGLMFLPALGVVCLGLTYSFNALKDPSPWMTVILHMSTVLFHGVFAIICLFAHDVSDFKTYIDISFAVISILADWYFYAFHLWSHFSSTDTVYYTILNVYIILSLWFDSAKSRRRPWRNHVTTDGILTMDKVKFIWVTRSAALVSKLYPDISHLWTSLREAWGEEATNKVCEVAIYVTDKDQEACAILKEELSTCPLYRSGAVKFERPNFPHLIENHTIELLTDPATLVSNTLLAFCGNPNLSVMVNQAKISNDISTIITDHSLHTMEFVSESYGGASKGSGGGGKKKKKTTKNSEETCAQRIENNNNDEEKCEEKDEKHEAEQQQLSLSIRSHTVHDSTLYEAEVPFPSQAAHFSVTGTDDDDDSSMVVEDIDEGALYGQLTSL